MLCVLLGKKEQTVYTGGRHISLREVSLYGKFSSPWNLIRVVIPSSRDNFPLRLKKDLTIINNSQFIAFKNVQVIVYF